MTISAAQGARFKSEVLKLIEDCGIAETIYGPGVAVHVIVGAYEVHIELIGGGLFNKGEECIPKESKKEQDESVVVNADPNREYFP